MSLQSIIDNIRHPRTNFTEISTNGGVVGIEIAWNCDLDWKLERCNPKYSFRRLDDPNVGISKGFNFRFARYHLEDGVQTRTLYKAYGILFKVVTTGRGGMFDFTTLVLKLGSMIALLGIAVVIGDVVVLYILKKRKYYRENKYQEVVDMDSDKEYEIITNPPEDPEARTIVSLRTLSKVYRHTPVTPSLLPRARPRPLQTVSVVYSV
jgi:P2X purinoceptor 4